MHENILKELYQPFNLKARPGQGGKTFKYVPSSDIMDRMNKVFRGNWSTCVVDSKVTEDQILILVRVIARDPNDDHGLEYYHEGYASHPIAKFTAGPKQGQIIDVGNSYRSAMSKAVKAAVAKWGVGLYLEEEDAGSSPSIETPTKTGHNPPPGPPPENPIIPPQAPVAKEVVPPTVPPVNIPPTVGADISVNPPAKIPVATPIFEPPQTLTPPPFTDTVTTPTVPIDIAGSGEPESRTSIQKVAIETILSVHNMDFSTLAGLALSGSADMPSTIDDVKYHDAVKLIQYGNNISQE
jgi:hypothetical protein